MKKCPYCSEINSDDANFCQLCGKRFPSPTQPSTTQTQIAPIPNIKSNSDSLPYSTSTQNPPPNPINIQNYGQEASQYQVFSPGRNPDFTQTPDRKRTSTPNPDPTLKRSIPLPVFITGIVLLIVIIGVSAFFLLNTNQENQAELDMAATQSYDATMAALVEVYSDGQIPASTPVPAVSIDTTLQYSGDYCEPKKATAALKKLKSIYGTGVESVKGSSNDSSTSTDEDVSLSAIDKIFIIGTIKIKQFRLSLIDVPPCLEPAKKSLDNAYEGVNMLMNVDEETSNEDLFVIILGTGLELSAYEDEIERIQTCLPVGCQPEQ